MAPPNAAPAIHQAHDDLEPKDEGVPRWHARDVLVKTEHLYAFDGVSGFSLGQGQ